MKDHVSKTRWIASEDNPKLELWSLHMCTHRGVHTRMHTNNKIKSLAIIYSFHYIKNQYSYWGKSYSKFRKQPFLSVAMAGEAEPPDGRRMQHSHLTLTPEPPPTCLLTTRDQQAENLWHLPHCSPASPAPCFHGLHFCSWPNLASCFCRGRVSGSFSNRVLYLPLPLPTDSLHLYQPSASASRKASLNSVVTSLTLL